MFTVNYRYLLKVFQSWETMAMEESDDHILLLSRNQWLLVATSDKQINPVPVERYHYDCVSSTTFIIHSFINLKTRANTYLNKNTIQQMNKHSQGKQTPLPSSAAIEHLFSTVRQTLCKLSYNMCDMMLFLTDRLKKCC